MKPSCMVVRDQGACGGCWCFAAVGAMSDTRCIRGLDEKRLVYSEQYQISCDTGNYGCNGGVHETPQIFLKNNGVPLDSCVKYVAKDTQCPTTCDNGATI